MKQWHVLMITSGREQEVERACRAEGWSAAYPYDIRHERRRDHKGRPVLIPKRHPMIGGYLFAAIPDDAAWARVRTMKYVTGYMLDRATMRPAALSSEDMRRLAEMRKLCRTFGARGVDRAVAVGDRVRVASGPFAGLESIVSMIKGNTVRLTAVLLNKRVPLPVEVGLVEKVA